MRLAGEWRELPFWAEFQRVSRSGGSDDELLSVYRDHGVVPRAGRDDNYNRPSEDLSKYQLVEPGDLAINKMKAWQGSLAISAYRGVVSPAYFVYRPSGAIDGRFAHYLLRSPMFVAALRSRSKGIRPAQWDLDPDALRTIPLNIPAPPLQKAIAEYLDRETAEIDAFIADQEKLIALLEERSAGLIERVIDEAEGELTRHRLAHDATLITSGSRGWAEYYSDSGAPFLRISNLSRGWWDLRRDDIQHVTAPEGAEGARTRTREGDLLFSITAFLGSVGVVSRIDAGSYVSQHIALVRPRAEVNSHFYAYQALASRIQSQLKTNAYGGTKVQLALGDIADLAVVKPELEKQASAVWRLDDGLGLIRAAIADAREAIALSKERRSALIGAAVTGQIEITEKKRVLV